MKPTDKDLFTAAGIAAIAGGILAYSIVTNKEIPVAPVRLSGLEQLKEMAKAGPGDCVPTMANMGNGPAELFCICNGVITKEISEYVYEKTGGSCVYRFDKTNFVAQKDKVQ